MAHRGERSILDELRVYLDIIDMMQRDGVLDTYEREISWRILKNKQDLCLNKNSHKEFYQYFQDLIVILLLVRVPSVIER